jgi:alpha-galactosidase
MKAETIATHEIADTTLRYVREAESGRAGIELYPTRLADARAIRRDGIGHESYIAAIPRAGDPPAWRVDPLAHVKLVGDPYPGAFAQGRTMRSSPGIDRFAFARQRTDTNGDRTTVVTALEATDGCRIEHRLAWHAGDAAAEVTTTFINGSSRPVTLELLTSFSLGGITPFAPDDAPGRLRIHRFRSVWSAEGRLQTETIEQLHLERSWSGAGLFSERFGQVGTMPVRGWFPFVAAEDVVAGVVWGAQLAWAGSWQMEVSRQNDELCLSGGLADREFGHWTKTLQPGESITSPSATVACVAGGIDELCDRLTAVQHRAADAHPAVEQELPIVFNEWCTTWGDPRHDRLIAIADKLKGSGARYFVIDAGWYKGDVGDWGNAHGDWTPSLKLFPDGLAATAAAIRGRGLIPGLWFEMETVGDASAAFRLTDHLLKRDGIPITVRHRRFWDLNDPFVLDYLTHHVIGTLRDGRFGYLKVDYNETIGLGCDGAESQGEALRQHVLGVYRFFERVRAALPDLVIENCSSGGHRLEPSMLARTAMSSFSDAHELVEIPIIAANLHRLMLPRQSQIWAVLHASDDERRLIYSLAATFLGRMCLSGDLDRLSQRQSRLVSQAAQLYAKAAPIIRAGTSRRYGKVGESWRHPRGWQGVVRTSVDGRRALLVLHAFAAAPSNVSIPLRTRDLPRATWRMWDSFGSGEAHAHDGNEVRWRPDNDFCAHIILMER